MNIIYCEPRSFILSPLAAALHLGQTFPALVPGESKAGTFLYQGFDSEKQRIWILLHGGYLPLIKNLAASLHQKRQFVPLEDLYSWKLKLGCILSSCDHSFGREWLEAAVWEIKPRLEQRVKEMGGN